MFLSHISLTPRAVSKRAVRTLLGHGVYGEHQLLCRLFDSKREDAFLFRRLDDASGMHFYTLSRHEPSSAAADDWEWTSKPFHPILREGQRLSFSVRINPTINRTESTPGDTGTRRRHRRRDIVYESLRAQRTTVARPASRTEIAQACGESWLQDRLLRNGFELGDAVGQSTSVICNAYRQHRIKKKNNAITISTLDCEGTGTVIDPQAFEALLPRGLGPAKGFGCGLMLIKPA